MRKYVQCYTEIEGMHFWKEAPDAYKYLSNIHRHTFKIRTVFEVCKDNREIEFIQKERDIKNFLLQKYGDSEGVCHFENMACEHIAKCIIEKFNAYSCEVLEDGEGGAKYVREQSESSSCKHWIDAITR